MVECIRRRLFVLGVLLCGLPVSSPGLAGDLDELPPNGARLGMERSEIFSISPPPRRLDSPLIFGPLRAEFMASGVAALGPPGTLYYQFDPKSGRLRQFLFEWRDADASKTHASDLLARLREKLGAPVLICIGGGREKPPRVVSARWRGAGLMLDVSILDHRADGVAHFDLNSDSDPRRPSHERRRVTRRSLPRRLTARLHGAEDVDLLPRRDCPLGSSPETR
jgi:hypothetical protein